MKLASTADLPALTALWATCFGDSPAEIQQFWETMWPEITVFATEDLAAMATAMPVRWQGRKAAYLYAVATDPSRRGEGLCSRLMADAENHLRKAGCSYAILSPAESSLFRFYGGMSYETAFYCSRAVFRGGCSQLSVRPVSPARYAALRREFAPESSVEYPDSLLSLQERTGPLLEIPGLGCAAVEPAEHGYVARELLSPNPQSAADALCAYLGCTLLPARMPGPVPFGMAKSLDGSPLRRAYLGLAFE